MRRYGPTWLLAGVLSLLALANLGAAAYRAGFGPGEIDAPVRMSYAEALYGVESGTFILMLPLALALLFALAATAVLAWRQREVPRQALAAAGVLLAGVLVLAVVVPLVAMAIRVNGFQDAAERMEPLVAAITRYEREHGARPEALDQLAPYISDVRRFGVRGCRPLEYRTEHVRGRWELHMDCPNGFLTLDQFFYRPERNYVPSELNQHIGSWAYFWD